ncbi:MAG: metalloregulator ArsR/SmtB family transcription factor [Chloroflexota bacterium]
MEISHRQADICAALADYHRMLLLYAVADNPQSVSELVRRVGLSQPAVSRHLRIMRESGVVVAERRGKSIFYIVTDRRIIQAMDLLRSSLSEHMQQQGEAAHIAAQRPPV